ncbi:AEC family transporter [Alteromonas facilis]|uniref:AEC family transporter n=1 Tax=Alteromonas facilis TaxID=2048004 RepID=UPI000C295970|nr:AEC family transporter [Alteromonas facilis]
MLANTLDFSIHVIGPVVILLALGKILFAKNVISSEFVSAGSRLVFSFALPALLFMSISQADFAQAANSRLIGTGLIVTLAFFLACLLFVQWAFSCREDRGVIVQGSFRANLGVIGLAYAANSFSPADFAQASVYMGALILLYNVLSVWVLNAYLPQRANTIQTLKAMATNPIMLSIVCALIVAYFKLSLPQIVTASTDYLAQLTLPLALICTGASIRFRDMKGQLSALLFSAISKCLLYPLIMIMSGIYIGMDQTELLTMLFMSVAPTAAVSFIMVKQMGGNADLAANIVALSTVISVPITLLGYQWVILLG